MVARIWPKSQKYFKKITRASRSLRGDYYVAVCESLSLLLFGLGFHTKPLKQFLAERGAGERFQ